MKPNVKAFVIKELRRSSMKWYAKSEARKRAFIRKDGRSHIFGCEMCGGEFKSKEIQADHIDPVVDIFDENQSMDKYIDRLFCEANGYQILCIECHNHKSAIEDKIKAQYRKGLLSKEEGYAILIEQCHPKKGNK